ncbi:MAG: hypothetical protein ACXW2U_08175 [Telluria sp.]
MNSAISSLLRFVSGKLISLLVIACILAFGNMAYSEWKQFNLSKADKSNVAGVLGFADAIQRAESAAAEVRVARLQTASLGILDARIADIGKSLRDKRAATDNPLSSFPLRSDTVRRHVEEKIRIEIMQQELSYLRQLRTPIAAGANRRAALQRLEQLRTDYISVNSDYFAAARGREDLRKQSLRRITQPFETHAKLKASDDECRRLAFDNEDKRQAYLEQKAVVARLANIGSLRAFFVDQNRVNGTTAPLRERLAAASEELDGNWFSRIGGPVEGMLPAAAMLLVGSFGLHLGFKAFFFYVLAPLAARRPPICLDPASNGEVANSVPARSARSKEVHLTSDEHLLILPQYVQSVPLHAKKDTKWLLDWTCPWTSLMSGLFALERIRTGQRDPIVLSSSDDPLCELALIELPAGSAMIFQPRGMVGVIHSTGAPLTITRHWRLGSLHSWLTLQFRYLIFRGPVTLVVRGTRGVRVERAGDGRAISQAATLGFSADVHYSTARGGTFLPYYQGKTALLQDSFQGGSGHYVYDETPRGGKQATRVGRGLEGTADALLKAFGI